MAKWVSEIIPDPKILLALEPEEIAPIVLEFLNSLSQDERGYLNRYAFGLHGGRGYAHEYQQRVACALMEGWMWLEREGLIAPNPEQHGDWVFITRRGQQMKSRANLEAYRPRKRSSSTTPAPGTRGEDCRAVHPRGLRHRRVPGVQGGRGRGANESQTAAHRHWRYVDT